MHPFTLAYGTTPGLKTVLKTKFGPYQTVAHLDTGGMAEVYLSLNTANNDLAVIKLLLEQYSDHEELLDMFRQEGLIMTLLEHPNVVKVLGNGDHESGLPYIVMEYLAGDHLGVLFRAAQKHHQKMSYTLVTRIAIQVANGLAYVHDASDNQGKSLGLVHRDISPQNIFLCYDGRVKLLDFGIALTRRRSTVTQAGKIKGKLRYMSPQQINHEPLDGRSDLFSLGIVIWQLLTGEKLFHADSEIRILKMICEEPIPSPRERRSDIPKGLDAIVMRCLERKPEDRFQSAADLRSALSQFLFYGDVQGHANELAMFTEYVLHRRKKKKDDIIASVRREHEMRERLFGDMDEQLPGFEFGEQDDAVVGSFTPVSEIDIEKQKQILGMAPPGKKVEVRCEWCGANIEPRPGQRLLCGKCRESAEEVTTVEAGAEWMVRKPDHRTLGPFSTKQILQQFEAGKIGAADLLAKEEGEQNFRLISVYPEFAPFFRLSKEPYGPGQATPSRFAWLRGWQGLLLIGILVIGLAGLGWWILQPTDVPQQTTLEKTLAGFAKEIPKPQGSSDLSRASGRKHMLKDRPASYALADGALKAALLLDPGSTETLADWVQNVALKDRGQGNIRSRKTALDLVEYTLQDHPESASLHRARALLFFSLGNHIQARESANRALELDGKNPENLLAVGASNLEHDTSLAVKNLEQAVQGNPELLIAYRLLAQANLELGRFHQALEILMRRLEKVPGEYETMMALVDIYLGVGQWKTARETLARIQGIEPGRAGPVVAMARMETQLMGHPKRAIRILEDFLKPGVAVETEERVEALTELSVAYRLTGKRKKANAIVKEALALQEHAAAALYASSIIELESYRAAPAMQQLAQLRQLLPQSARILARMAEAQILLPNFDQASHYLEQAIELEPEDLDINLMLAALLLYMDLPTPAYERLRLCCSVDPMHAENRRTLSNTFDGRDFLRLSVSRMSEVSEKYGNQAEALTLHGLLLYRNGQASKSKKILSKALTLDPESACANLYLGIMAMESRKLSQALKYLQTAHGIEPNEPTILKLMARAMHRKRKYKEAKNLYRRALKIDKTDSDSLVGLAEVHLATRNKKKAASLLNQAYEIDNSNLKAKQLLYRLGI